MTHTHSQTMTFSETNPCRIVINLGNPLLATRSGDDTAQGVSVDLAQAWCDLNRTQPIWLMVDNAREAVALLEEKKADLGFLAVDPLRAQQLQFTRPYLLIDGCYVVHENSPIVDHHKVDRDGHRVVVGLGSAYDLFLSRHLKHAELVKAPSSKAVVEVFLQQKATVAAGVKQQLIEDLQTHPGLRLLAEPFMQIQQAMVIHRDQGVQALQTLQSFMDACVSDGRLAKSMATHSVTGARIANHRAV